MMKFEMGGDELSLLQFILEMTKALAWPVVVACIAFAFRNQIKSILQRDGEASALGATVKWTGADNQLKAVSAEVAVAAVVDPAVPQTPDGGQDPEPAATPLRPTARWSFHGQSFMVSQNRIAAERRLAVRAAWEEVEQALEDAAAHYNLADMEPMVLADQLKHMGRLSGTTLELLIDMHEALAPALFGNAWLSPQAEKHFREATKALAERIVTETDWKRRHPLEDGSQ